MDNSGMGEINEPTVAQRPTEEDCGCTEQISGVNVCNCVKVGGS